MNEIRIQSREDFYRLWSAWKPRIRRSPSVWAVEERRVASGGPLARGEDIPYDHAVMPHLRVPMDEADNPDVEIIVLWLGRRLGKSEGFCMNIIGRNVNDDPTNMISMWPVEDSRDRFSRDCVEKTIEATPSLRTAFVEKKSRDSGRTIDFKRFAGGSLIINYAGSKSQTKGMAAGAVFAHEVDAYPVSSQGEGDPISKLFGRTEGFEDAIKVIESTGTWAADIEPSTGKKIYNSNIEMWYDRSDQQKYFCPCRSCGRGNWLKWEQIKRLTRKSGDLTYYVCEDCDKEHDERQWRRMVAAGEWKPTAPFKGIRGFWSNGFISLFPRGKGFTSKLEQFLVQGERALAGTPEEKQVWINEVKSELVAKSDESVEPPPSQPLLDNREAYATAEKVTVPKAGLVVTAMTDVHGDRLEIEWRAWGRNEESWGLGHYVLFGDTNRADVWEQWTRHLQMEFDHESGAKLRLSLAFIDGGWRVDPILGTLRRLAMETVPGVSGKIRISKGVPEWTSVIYRRWGTIKDKAKGVHIGTWCAKSLLYDRLRWHSAKPEDKPSAGFIHYGQNYSDEFLRQVVSEKSVMRIDLPRAIGKEVETFKNPESNRNEALDLLVGNLAAFRYGRWNFDTIEIALREQVEAKQQPQPREPEVSRLRETSGWMSGMGGFRV